MIDFVPFILSKNYPTKVKYSDLIITKLRKLIISPKTINSFLKNFNKNLSTYKVYGIYFVKKLYIFIKEFVLNLCPFIKMFIIYLINKYYYKLSDLDFVMKVYRERETFEFFRQLNRIKSLFFKERGYHAMVAKVAIYYLILLAFLTIYGPMTWFSLRVLTDPQNWMMHDFEDIRLGLNML